MKKLTAVLFVVGLMVGSTAMAELCPTVNYELYHPVAYDGQVAGGTWVANVPADEI